jgi:hypothetical protein
MRRGQRRVRRGISVSHIATERPCGAVVGRLLDAFDKDASGSVRPATLCKVRNPAAGVQRSEARSGTGDLVLVSW